MKGKDLWEALGEIDPKYIQEAELSGRSRTGRQKWQAAAACFLVIALGAAIVVPNLLWSQDSILWGGIGGDSQDQSGQQTPITGSDSAENTIQISLSDVPVNIISGLPEGEMTDMSYVALMSEDQITWSQEQVESYYGLDFDTLSAPEDLEAVADLSQGMAVWENEDGTMRFDGLLLSYQSTGQEDPEETQRSLSLHGSKIGLLALSDPGRRNDRYVLCGPDVRGSDYLEPGTGGELLRFGFRHSFGAGGFGGSRRSVPGHGSLGKRGRHHAV